MRNSSKVDQGLGGLWARDRTGEHRGEKWGEVGRKDERRVGKLPERQEMRSKTVPVGAGPWGRAVGVRVLGGLAPSLAFAQGLHAGSHCLSDAMCDRHPRVEQASLDILLAGPGLAAAPERKPFSDLSSPLAGPG